MIYNESLIKKFSSEGWGLFFFLSEVKSLTLKKQN